MLSVSVLCVVENMGGNAVCGGAREPFYIGFVADYCGNSRGNSVGFYAIDYGLKVGATS